MGSLQVLVAGGGIGGLATAAGLAIKGIRSSVVEQSSTLGEIGAGIQIGPNAFHCFDYLGIGSKMRAEAVYIDALRLMDALNGHEISQIPLGESFRKKMGNPYAVIHRADLHNTLLDFCKESRLIDIYSGFKIESFDQEGNVIKVYSRGQKPLEGNVLVGADGLNSVIREQILNDGEPIVSGHATYRSVIPLEEMPKDLRWNAATLWAGPRCHIVHYPLKGWKYFNLVVTYHRDIQEAISGKPVSQEEVMEGFEHVSKKAKQIIEHGNNWKLWVLCDREPVNNWTSGRVTLLGDAAHPMLQYFAQGACMAMEDAVCISHCLSNFDNIDEALKSYQAQRLVRTARVQMSSRLIGDYIYHPDGVQAQVRNQLMSSISPDEWVERLYWLYGSNGLSL